MDEEPDSKEVYSQVGLLSAEAGAWARFLFQSQGSNHQTSAVSLMDYLDYDELWIF